MGTSNRNTDNFIHLLNRHQIKVVIDIRRFPRSRFPHFQQNNLIQLLSENEIQYVFLGDVLGGYRKTGYEQYTKTEDYQTALSSLEEIANNMLSVFICAEKDSNKCHRRYIANDILKRGWQVNHIIDEHLELEESEIQFHLPTL